MNKTACLIATVMVLAGCGGLEVTPSPIASHVTLAASSTDLPGTCIAGPQVKAYGSSEAEVWMDLRHQAYEKTGANWVVTSTIEPFYQDKRMQNYQRIPQMKAPRGTKNYFYEAAFTMTTTGETYQCSQ